MALSETAPRPIETRTTVLARAAVKGENLGRSLFPPWRMESGATVLAQTPIRGEVFIGPGLAAEWTLTQASILGATVADASGNGNAGTVINGPLTFGARGANFNGQQYVDSALTVTSSALTVSVWFNAANLSNANPRIVANSHPDVDVKGFQLVFNKGGASGFFEIGNGTTERRASWSQQLVAGTWYHYAGVYDGATVRAYLNGVQVATAAYAGGAIAAGTGPHINIARNPTYNGDYFIGAVSDVRIYKRGLSAAEIVALYQASPNVLATGTGIVEFGATRVIWR